MDMEKALGIQGMRWTYSYVGGDKVIESGEIFASDPLPPPGEEKPDGWQSAFDKASAAAVKYDADNPGEQNVAVHPYQEPS